MKITRGLYAKVMALILFYRGQAPAGINEQEILNEVYGRIRHEQNDPLYAPLRELLVKGETATSQQIQAEFQEAHENISLNDQDNAPIIERILTILSKPWTGNKGVQKNFAHDLRRAILTPEERDELFAKLDSEELRCWKCQHGFTPGEAVTFQTSIGRNPRVSCTTCTIPSYKRCGHPGCDQKHAFTMVHKKCKDHVEGTTTMEVLGGGMYGDAQPPEGPPPNAGDQLRENFAVAFRQVQQEDGPFNIPARPMRGAAVRPHLEGVNLAGQIFRLDNILEDIER